MALHPLSDLSPADWFVNGAESDWWTQVCLGPMGYEAYARLQLVPEDEDSALDLGQLTVEAMRRILPSHTSTADKCYFGQWIGSGWEPPIAPTNKTFSLVGEVGPGIRTTVREYHLFAGTLEDSRRWDGGDPPHLMWPADHAWFAAKDVDPEWVGVGGTQTLINEILADPTLDAAPSDYDASTWDTRCP